MFRDWYWLVSVWQSQYTALTQACQHGYFKIPRELDLDDLAAMMNISHQALSERLRRGHETLIKTTLLGTHPTSPRDNDLDAVPQFR